MNLEEVVKQIEAYLDKYYKGKEIEISWLDIGGGNLGDGGCKDFEVKFIIDIKEDTNEP
jgi:diaminopimelate decarboxylase